MRRNANRSEHLAILSSCCGVTGELVFTDSAVIILYAGLLGAGDFFSLATTAVLPLCNGLLILPFACLSGRIDGRVLMRACCLAATGAYLLAAAAPFFGRGGLAALTIALVLFSVSIPGFIAGWFPLLGTFLSAERRTGFLGRMRFLHQLSAVSFLFLVSCVTGENPGAGTMQLILLAGAVVFAGRELFLERIPRHASERIVELPWKSGLAAAFRNRKLMVFAFWQFILNLSCFGIVPAAMLYLKNELKAGDDTIIAVSAVALGGMLFGYLVAAKLAARTGIRAALGGMTLLCAAAGAGLFLCGGAAGTMPVLIFLALVNFSIASSSVLCSALMMELAAAENWRIAMACCGALQHTGSGAARLLAPVLIGLGISIGGTGAFRTFFLICGVASAGVFLLLPRTAVTASRQ